jgi:protein-tyrosine phosphatase
MSPALSHLNLRDLGALPMGGGGRVRRGVLFRCEGPAASTNRITQSWLLTACVPLPTCVRKGERATAPHRPTGNGRRVSGTGHEHGPLRPRAEEWEALRTEPNAACAFAAMMDNYRLMPSDFLLHLSAMVDALAAGETPMPIRRSAGNERTGVVVALLLEYLDIARDALMADYLQSEIFRQIILASGQVEDR